MSSTIYSTRGKIYKTMHESFQAASLPIVAVLLSFIASWPSSPLITCWYRWESYGSSCRRPCIIRFLRPWWPNSYRLPVGQICWTCSCPMLYCFDTILWSLWISDHCLLDSKSSIFWRTHVMALLAWKNGNARELCRNFWCKTRHLQGFSSDT